MIDNDQEQLGQPSQPSQPSQNSHSKPKPKSKPILLDMFLIAVCLFVLAVVAFVWRVSYAPLDISFMKASVEAALENKEAGRRVSIDGLVVHWPDFHEPMLLGLKGSRVLNAADDRLILAIDEIGLGVSKRYLFLGKLRPKVLILKRPELKLVRTEQGRLDFGLGDLDFEDDGQMEIVQQEALVDRILGVVSGSGSEEGGVFSSLKRLKINDAQLHFDDRLYGQRFHFSDMDASFSSAKAGLELEFAAELVGLVGNKSLPRLYVKAVIDAQNKLVDAQGALQDFAVSQLAELHPSLNFLRGQEGVLDVGFVGSFDEHIYPKSLSLKLASTEGALALPELYDKKLSYSDLKLSISFDEGVGEALKLSDSSVVLEGIKIDLSGSVEVAENDAKASLRVNLPFVEHKNIVRLWPKVLEGDNSELWVVKRLSDGVFKNSFAELYLSGLKDEDGAWDVGLDDVDAEFNFEGLSVDYRSPMMPIKEAAGQGNFNYKSEDLNIEMSSAKLGDLSVSDAKLKFAKIIEAGAGQAEMHMKVQGRIKDLLKYVALEPIDFTPDFDVEGTKGVADLAVHIAFPTRSDIKMSDVRIGVEGVATEVLLPKVVKNLTLSGGPFAIGIAENVFSTSGKGELDKRPVVFDYQTFLSSKGEKYKSKIKASITADEDLRNSFGIDLSDFVRGNIGVDVVYTEYHGGRSEADVVADLTPAQFFVEDFAYNKKVGLKGEATLRAVLQKDNLIEINGLSGSAPDFAIKNATLSFRQGGADEPQVSAVKLPSLSIGKTQGFGEMLVNKSGARSIDFTAAHFDLRPFVSSDEAGVQSDDRDYDKPPLQVTLSANTLQMDEVHLMKQGKIVLDIDDKGSFNRLEMDALAGGAPVYLRYKPDAEGKRVFRFEADDAGATLAALGLYDKMREGKIVVYAEPIRGVRDRNLIGSAEITNFKVVKAPALARLFGVLSLGGIADLLGKEGLSFKKLEANFDWLYRPQGSLLVLQDGRTSGSSVGMTFDGVFDKKAGTVDVSGTVVPMSSLNNFLGSIPIIGTLLTGGNDGGIFAATYTMKGEAKDPDVAVNPLSVLAPGIIRRILFE